jgi:hypothetical protein
LNVFDDSTDAYALLQPFWIVPMLSGIPMQALLLLP